MTHGGHPVFPTTIYGPGGISVTDNMRQGLTKRELFSALLLAGAVAHGHIVDAETCDDAVRAAENLITSLNTTKGAKA